MNVYWLGINPEDLPPKLEIGFRMLIQELLIFGFDQLPVLSPIEKAVDLIVFILERITFFTDHSPCANVGL